MKTVDFYQAKTNLSKLLEQVQAGKSIVITKAGKPVADLVPHSTHKPAITYGKLKSKISFDDKDFVGLDTNMQKMFNS